MIELTVVVVPNKISVSVVVVVVVILCYTVNQIRKPCREGLCCSENRRCESEAGCLLILHVRRLLCADLRGDCARAARYGGGRICLEN